MNRDEHKQWFQETVDRFKSLPPEVRDIELNHLEMALKEAPAPKQRKKPGPKKGYKRGPKAGLPGLVAPTGPGVAPG